MQSISKKVQKVVLVNPNITTKTITDKFTIPALGLESIAASIKDLVQVKIIDGKVSSLSLQEIIEEINEFKPDIVGISCCFTLGIEFALRIAEESKKRGYITILGGWHPSFEYSELLQNSFVDIIVRGEGELTFRELVKNKKLEEVKGISYKINGTVMNNPDRPLVKDLNKLPLPARYLRDRKANYQFFQMPLDVIETSRGCPFNCTFCNIHLFYRGTYRTKSTERIIKELKIIEKHQKNSNVLIVDDNFTANMKRVEEICDKIILNDIKLDLICLSRVDVIKNHPNIIKKMSQAGFWLIFLGIESFNQKSLDGIQKKIQFRDIVQAINILHDNDILIVGSLLIGSNLDEKESDIDLMIKIVKKLRIDFPLYSIMTPLPGTKFRDVLIENNYLKSYDWSKYDFTTAVNRLNILTSEKLGRLLSKAYFYGYFNRGWKDTFMKLYKKKKIKSFLNLRRIINITIDFLGFFKNIYKMKYNSA